MGLLTEDQKARVREEFYTHSQTCYNCMPFNETDNVWVIAHWPLGEAVEKAFENSEVLEEIEYDLDDHIDEVIAELALKCPNCDNPLVDEFDELGDSFSPESSPGVTDDPESYKK